MPVVESKEQGRRNTVESEIGVVRDQTELYPSTTYMLCAKRECHVEVLMYLGT